MSGQKHSHENEKYNYYIYLTSIFYYYFTESILLWFMPVDLYNQGLFSWLSNMVTDT